MKFKVVPEPRPISFLREAQQSMPLVPGSEDDCCARLMASVDIESRDVAREWITFMQALGVVAASDGRYYQRRVDPAPEDLSVAFRDRVYVADDVVSELERSDGPLSAATVFERVRDAVPTWERNRRQDWEAVWRERVRRLLEWAVVFDLVDEVEGEYRA